MFLVNSRHPPSLCPPHLVAQIWGTLIPKLRVQFAEFLQRRSLKRPWYTLPVHLCWFRVRSTTGAVSWNAFAATANPISGNNLRHSSHPRRPRNINLVPIAYGFRPRLRGRLTLRGLALRRNPWTFGESVSHTLYRYSCQHSHFRYLQHASRHTFTGLRNAPLPLQRSDIRNQGSGRRCPPWLVCKP